MKKIFLTTAILCIAYLTNAQTLGYNDLGILFSSENQNGTARYNAMGGAFGALGGDISAIESNPAGAAVFINSQFAASFHASNNEISANYYGNSSLTELESSNFSQAGGVFIFDRGNSNGWGKIALGFNYSIANDFENLWMASGNSNYPTWIEDPNDPAMQYLYSDEQYFESNTNGSNKKYSFTIASQYNDNLYFGASLNTYDLVFSQNILLEEYNDDNAGNLLDASLIQELLTFGDGISFNFGVISKPSDNMRFGIAYQSPVWYDLSEDFLDYDIELTVSNTGETFTDYSGINAYDYKLRTPSKTTLSAAYIFDKFGLISFDYIYKNYKNIQLSEGNFSQENQTFESNLNGTGEIRLGTEWRFNNLSLRGGYNFEKDPYSDALDSDHKETFSLGAGLRFRGGKIDISYQNSSRTTPYDYYAQYSEINAAELSIDNTKLTVSLVLDI